MRVGDRPRPRPARGARRLRGTRRRGGHRRVLCGMPPGIGVGRGYLRHFTRLDVDAALRRMTPVATLGEERAGVGIVLLPLRGGGGSARAAKRRVCPGGMACLPSHDCRRVHVGRGFDVTTRRTIVASSAADGPRWRPARSPLTFWVGLHLKGSSICAYKITVATGATPARSHRDVEIRPWRV